MSNVEQKINKKLKKRFWGNVSKLYNLTISHKYKFIWLRVAKVGTRSRYAYLKNSDVPLHAEHPFRVCYRPEKYSDHFKFAFIRNPWDRLVSAWADKIVKYNYFNLDADLREEMLDFTRFLDYVEALNIKECDPHLRLQLELIDLNNIDFVGRFEDFDIHFTRFCRILNFPSRCIKKRNSTNRRQYQAYYDDMLGGRLGAIYDRDIQIFGYEF